MLLAPIKKPCRDVTNSIAKSLAAEKLYRDAAASSAPTDFQTPADVGYRDWRAPKAIGYVILTSQKTGLSRGIAKLYRSNVIPRLRPMMRSAKQ